MAKALMLIITIVCIAYIVYNFIKDKPIINIFFCFNNTINFIISNPLLLDKAIF